MSEPVLTEQDLFAQKHLKTNLGLYMATMGTLAFCGAFGDTGTIIQNLALKLHAPLWLATFPAIAATSIGFLPAVILGGLLRPGSPKKAIYAAMCMPFYGAFLVLAIGLLVTENPAILRGVLFCCALVTALATGGLVLPYWEIFYKVFPASVRGRVIGHGGGLMGFISIFSAAIAAWLISGKPIPFLNVNSAPPAFPLNYSLGLIVFWIGGVASVGMILLYREYRVPQAEVAASRSFGQYAASLWDILHNDRSFRTFIGGAVLAATIANAAVLIQGYALTQRAFTEQHLSILILLRPIIAIPSAIVFGHLTDRFGARRMCALNGFLALVGIAIAPLLSGLWMLIPIILSGYAGGIYSFVMVGILNHAPQGRNQDYLCAYYLVIMLPGLLPIFLAKIMDSGAPLLAVGIAAVLCLLATVVLAVSGRNEKGMAAAAAATD